jgi:hypothetical protein
MEKSCKTLHQRLYMANGGDTRQAIALIVDTSLDLADFIYQRNFGINRLSSFEDYIVANLRVPAGKAHGLYYMLPYIIPQWGYCSSATYRACGRFRDKKQRKHNNKFVPSKLVSISIVNMGGRPWSNI